MTDVRTVQKRLQDAEEAIDFINKEETLYKWDLSSYPVVEVIKESIEPYQKLFGLVLKWQRTEKRSVGCLGCCHSLHVISYAVGPKTMYSCFMSLSEMFRWMDGSFLDLNGESMEVEVDEFFREIYKMLKFFQQKQKKAEQMAGGGVKRRPGEEDPGKQERPTALICSTVMEQVKDFKVTTWKQLQCGNFCLVLVGCLWGYNGCLNYRPVVFKVNITAVGSPKLKQLFLGTKIKYETMYKCC